MAGGVCEVGHRDRTKPEREELKGHTFRCAVGRLSFCHPEPVSAGEGPAFETFRQPVRSCRKWPVKGRPSHAFLLTCVTLRVTVENDPLAPPQRTKAPLRGRRSSRRH